MFERSRKIMALPNDLCDGCGECVDACAQALSTGRSAAAVTGVKIISSDGHFVPILCRNCQDAPCVTACMTGCIQQTGDELVITDYNRCVGCWMCVMSCPFGAIELDTVKHIAVKCNGCLDHEVAPCVASCDKGVLLQLDMGDFTEKLRKEAAARFIGGVLEDVKT